MATLPKIKTDKSLYVEGDPIVVTVTNLFDRAGKSDYISLRVHRQEVVKYHCDYRNEVNGVGTPKAQQDDYLKYDYIDRLTISYDADEMKVGAEGAGYRVIEYNPAAGKIAFILTKHNKCEEWSPRCDHNRVKIVTPFRLELGTRERGDGLGFANYKVSPPPQSVTQTTEGVTVTDTTTGETTFTPTPDNDCPFCNADTKAPPAPAPAPAPAPEPPAEPEPKKEEKKSSDFLQSPQFLIWLMISLAMAGIVAAVIFASKKKGGAGKK